MKFHTFGNKDNEIIVLIHGVLTPWQIWQTQIDYLKGNYFVIVPALDGHIEDENSEYISASKEAEHIEQYICQNYGNKVFAVCGLSMGGAIANIIFGSGKLQMKYLVFDGAPLIPMNMLVTKFMIHQYLTIIHKSKNRDPKVLESFKKDFLPEKYLEHYLRFVDTMSDQTIENMIVSVGKSRLCICNNENNTKILFLHGTKGNEVLAKKSAKLVKRYYPETKIVCLDGYAHGEAAIYKPQKWIDILNDFILDN